MVIWHWYYIGSNIVTKKLLVPFLDVIRVLFNRRDATGVVAIATTYTANLESNRKVLHDFFVDAKAPLKQLMYLKNI